MIDDYRRRNDHIFNVIFMQIFNHDQIHRMSSVWDEVVKQSRGRKEIIVKVGTCKLFDSENIYTEGYKKLVILIKAYANFQNNFFLVIHL